MSAPAPFGACLPELRVPPPGPASQALARRLREVESRNVTHLTSDWPVFWEDAAGANVRDVDGNVYLDLTGGFGVALLGHSDPGVAAAVSAQAERLVHGMGDVHPSRPKVELLERLAELSPWTATRTVLASTGSEAVEIALKTALVASGRPGLLAFRGGYHGLTLGSLAVTERELFRGPFRDRIYPGVVFVPFPEARRGKSEDSAAESLDLVRRALREGAPNGDPIGAVIVEPVQGRAGVRVAPEGFLTELSDVAHEEGVLVVADEVQTGMGRCGAWLASDRVGLKPDIVCIGKALGAGLPLSACMGSSEVMDAWPESEGEAVHTSSFLGHPLACAAALAFLSDGVARDLPGLVRERGERILEGLRSRLGGVSGVGDVRGLGLLAGVELVEGIGMRPREGAAARGAAEALARGLIVLPAGGHGHVLEMTPPVVVTDRQIGFALDALEAVIQGATRPHGQA